MHILLINSNPVVSRLLTLCTRSESYLLDESNENLALAYEQYDVVFVDEDAYNTEVETLLATASVGRKVLISHGKELHNNFDMMLQKPFLPSQVMDLLEEIEADIHIQQYNEINLPQSEVEEYIFELEEVLKNETLDKVENIKVVEFTEPLVKKIDVVEKVDGLEKEVANEENIQILDENEIEKIKALLEMDDEPVVVKEKLDDKEYEARKIEAIKKQLMEEGLEIIEEEDIVEELEIATIQHKTKNSKLKSQKAKKDKKKDKDKDKDKKPKKKKKQQKETFELTEAHMLQIEDAIEIAITTMKEKKMKKFLKGKRVKIALKLESTSS